MTIAIWTENNTLVVKHNFVVGVLQYASVYESWILETFNLKINGMVDLNKHQVRFLINDDIGVDTVATAFKLEFG